MSEVRLSVINSRGKGLALQFPSNSLLWFCQNQSSMIHSYFRRTSLLPLVAVLVMCSFSATAFAQVQSSDFTDTYKYTNVLLPIAKGRIARFGADDKAFYISTYDSSASEVWKKTYPNAKKAIRGINYLSSADGNDIWIISSYPDAGKKGPKEFSVLCVDALTGESTSRTFPEQAFGYIHSTWANDKYLFITTTQVRMYDGDIATKAGLRLFRIDATTLEMTQPEHEMDKGMPYGNVFWEMLRVENDFVEGYMVVTAGNAIGLKFARFDNDGKLISTKETAFRIKAADHFTRQIHGYCSPGPGVGEPNHSYYAYSAGQNIAIELIYPLASVQVSYCAKTQTYWAVGVIGKGEQKKVGTPYDGFFLAKLNADFGVAEYSEYIDQPLLDKDKNFKIHATPDGHHVQCYFDPAGNPVVGIGSEAMYYFVIDQSGLLVKTSYKAEQEHYQNVGSIVDAGSNWIVSDPDAVEVQGRMSMFQSIVSGNYQYAVKQNYSSGSGKILTKKVR